MSRVKRGPIPRRRHNRVFKQTEGFVGSRRNRYREAVRVLFKSWEYAYVGRKLRKRDFRTLWIQRINAARHHVFALHRRAQGVRGRARP